ncbi:MAG: undecaprenyldiphospho-muramoylpentapeptide beta-N-acetylglucosaminyltransferase [Candidatus Omnitrophica bacterium]|nr:undecaprenyldiphospho-muramoylpentapeptide beta-N-acetylglucosaminyltransferase [Candidatus Omnitrophota bacterium]
MKILLATGGSGGHIFPALVTAQELRSRGHEIVFAGAFRQSGSTIKAAGFRYFEISAKGFSPANSIAFFFATIKSFFESVSILKQIRPDIVVGFGGYGAFPVVMAGALQGIPTMIQEQNVVPGKANKVLSVFVKRIAVGFEQALKYFPSEKAVLTGCPCRPIADHLDRLANLKSFGLPEGVPVILVLGGSQGSQRINAEFIRVIKELKDKLTLGIIHICGDKDAKDCKITYEGMSIAHCVFSFTDEIDKAYSVADLVISRAGAMTVTELAAFALPAILIPYPYAGGHQRENALVLTQGHVSHLVDEKDLTSALLTSTVLEMMNRKMTKDEIAKLYSGIYRPDAAKRLSDEIENLKK